MKAKQLNEFNKADYQENESVNLHSENALELAKEFGTPEEVEAMQRIMDQHMRRGHILPHEIEERNALTSKYYSMLEHSVNPSFKSTLEGYKVMPAMDPKYIARDGLEGPFSTLSGKVVYYDPKEGSYYDPDTDMYMSYDEFQKYDNDYSGMKDERDEVKDIEPQETVKGPRGHLSSIVADAVNEIDCWDGYKKDGTKPGTGKNKGKRVNNCVKEEDVTVDNAGNISGYLATIDEYVEMLADANSHYDRDEAMDSHTVKEIAYRIQNAVDDIRTRELGMKPSNIRSKFNEDEVNEEHDIGLLKAVARQMEADAHKGDYTAIEELLQDVSIEELKGFLSDHRDMDMDEGKSPHKKGTEKYKKHMAAMHASQY
tara:strand:- start:803 stop:1915 length:1113 start_codon:yes stop_codon:yes gene_type:complete